MYEGKSRLICPVWPTEVQHNVKALWKCTLVSIWRKFSRLSMRPIPRCQTHPSQQYAVLYAMSSKWAEKELKSERVRWYLESWRISSSVFDRFIISQSSWSLWTKPARIEERCSKVRLGNYWATAVVSLPLSRGRRVSVLAAFNSHGFFACSLPQTLSLEKHSTKHLLTKSFLILILTRYPIQLLLLSMPTFTCTNNFKMLLDREYLLFFLPA